VESGVDTKSKHQLVLVVMTWFAAKQLQNSSADQYFSRLLIYIANLPKSGLLSVIETAVVSVGIWQSGKGCLSHSSSVEKDHWLLHNLTTHHFDALTT
jgi:hypothetical protein